jgi:hypothetical protein
MRYRWLPVCFDRVLSVCLRDYNLTDDVEMREFLDCPLLDEFPDEGF